jgi:hypothetical protein
MPVSIGRVVSHRFATLIELQTVYGAEDFYNMMEIMAVDAYNQRVLSEQRN